MRQQDFGEETCGQAWKRVRQPKDNGCPGRVLSKLTRAYRLAYEVHVRLQSSARDLGPGESASDRMVKNLEDRSSRQRKVA